VEAFPANVVHSRGTIRLRASTMSTRCLVKRATGLLRCGDQSVTTRADFSATTEEGTQ
jgi:hypothetical protein